ncbi:hypothetical protein BMS3Bbin04_01775 [bacterium BMS3Bbin04]|nr:hypothetical protein BMS3Bbin04_01775 [bacterium BMS3Bbin04]
MIIGSCGWDAQHNGGCGRSIGYADGEDWNVYIVWTKLTGLDQGNPRHVVYTTVTDDGAGGFLIDPLPQVQFENGYRSGYTTLAYDSPNAVGYGTFHYSPASGDPWSAVAVIENPWVPNLFNMGTVPNPFANEHIWPHSVFGNTNHVHMTMHELRVGAADMMQITYYRFAPDPVTGVMTPAHDGDPHVITDMAMNISTDIAPNSTGEQLAAGIVMARFGTLGEVFGESDDTQWNNDMYVFQSPDAGVTWEEPIDVTQFIGPIYDALPDTNAANGDTMRVYTDVSVVYDDEDDLHVAFTAGVFDFFRVAAYYESRIFHWMLDDNGDDVWTQINYQPWVRQVEGWARTTDRPSLYFDDDTGILWCAMEVCDGGPDTTDFGESGIVNSDIFVTASPPGEYNGLLWTTPVNVTNTKWLDEGPAPVGECRAESDVSIALDSDGDYLHMTYLLDLDAGTGIGTAPEGEMTDNPIVYHRIAKQDLLDIFEANAEWQPNYPMHVDSTGFWQDPGNSQWAEYGGFFTGNREELSVGEGSGLQPNEFELKQNYPNPFNPSTSIEFSLARAGMVKLAVYNVLGQEIATLVDRRVNAGTHNVTFMADELPSGVYFYKLSADGNEKVRKMVLMK